jgi:hypothetical protein
VCYTARKQDFATCGLIQNDIDPGREWAWQMERGGGEPDLTLDTSVCLPPSQNLPSVMGYVLSVPHVGIKRNPLLRLSVQSREIVGRI